MRQSPRSVWGVALGISIIFSCAESPLQAAKEPVIRVLVGNSNKFRMRADSNIPLLIKGVNAREKRVRSVNLQIKNGRVIWSTDKNLDRWTYLPSKSYIRVTSSDPRGIWLGKRRYRGELRVGLKNQRLIAINHLGIEKYLMSVVGSEMPKDWPIAALKAQAVAARTYALKRIGSKGFFDINSTESSQVYLGIESETKTTVHAVNSTRSLVIRHKGKLISAVFHSSSGGQTENSGSVWKYQLPYLISVGDYDQHNPKFRWSKKFSPSKLKHVFFEIGGLNNIQVLRASQTGRVLDTKLYGPKGNLFLSGTDLRRRLGLKSTLVQFEMVPYSRFDSTATTKSPILKNRPTNLFPPTPSKDYFLLAKGYGAGHGVGMSQWGANGLAKKGANFRRILNHYYSGVKVSPY